MNQFRNLVIFNEEEQRDQYNPNQIYYKCKGGGEKKKKTENYLILLITNFLLSDVMVDNLKTHQQKPIGKDQEPYSISDIKWSSDSNFFATLNNASPHALFIWEIQTLELKSILYHQNPIKSFTWSKNSNQLLLVTGKNRIFIWNPDVASICDIPFGN